jgi:hypothetical protein
MNDDGRLPATAEQIVEGLVSVSTVRNSRRGPSVPLARGGNAGEELRQVPVPDDFITIRVPKHVFAATVVRCEVIGAFESMKKQGELCRGSGGCDRLSLMPRASSKDSPANSILVLWSS